mmetsp:Transcript_56716/g.133125  ORF Transcript_56716/g.133125 Transcript_56716/m.133125 type:complete len:223 (-) Transcript_56716:610-1278(-)
MLQVGTAKTGPSLFGAHCVPTEVQGLRLAQALAHKRCSSLIAASGAARHACVLPPKSPTIRSTPWANVSITCREANVSCCFPRAETNSATLPTRRRRHASTAIPIISAFCRLASMSTWFSPKSYSSLSRLIKSFGSTARHAFLASASFPCKALASSRHLSSASEGSDFKRSAYNRNSRTCEVASCNACCNELTCSRFDACSLQSCSWIASFASLSLHSSFCN